MILTSSNTNWVKKLQSGPEEPIKVIIPVGVPDTLPEITTTISVDSAGKVSLNVNDTTIQSKVIVAMMELFKLDEELISQARKRLGSIHNICVPVKFLLEYIDSDSAKREDMTSKSPGIPIDSNKVNELAYWVNYSYKYAKAEYETKLAKKENVKPPRFTIKADRNAKYEIVKQVITTYQKQGLQHFDLRVPTSPRRN